MGTSACVRARALLQEPSFAAKVTALQRWCDEHRPQEKMMRTTTIATEWGEKWKVGAWVNKCRSRPHRVPEEHRAAFEAAVERSGYRQVSTARWQRSVRGHTKASAGLRSPAGRVRMLMVACPCIRAHLLL